MGLFGAIGRALAGKPAYTPEQVARETGADQSHMAGTDQQADAGPKSIPMIRIGRVESRISGPWLAIYAHVENQSAEALFLDRVFFLGIKRELDSELRPGESRQLMLYSGPLLTSQPRGYAEVQYRKQSDGDYFANYHQVRSRQTEHGWEVTECLLQGPVKDI